MKEGRLSDLDYRKKVSISTLRIMAKICINNNHIRWRTCVANSDERIARIGEKENKKEKENNNNSIVSIRVLNLLVDFTRESLVPSDCNRNSVSF